MLLLLGPARRDASSGRGHVPGGHALGSASAGFQVESGNQTSDWGHWVTMPGKIKNGDTPDVGGPDAFAHLDEDVRR